MDEFAQSREDDDLFADEFEPLPEPTATIDEIKPDVHIPPQNIPAPIPATINHQTPPTGPARGGHRNNRRDQGTQDVRRQRGGRGGQGHNGLGQSRYAPQSQAPPVQPESNANSNPATTSGQASQPSAEWDVSPPQPSQAPANTSDWATTSGQPSQAASSTAEWAATSGQATQPPPQPEIAASPVTPSQPSNHIPTAPQQPLQTRTPAVRGDRSATGGPLHKKLTEEELTAKLEKMAIINAQKAERHRLQEADQAAYDRKEKEAAKERQEKSRMEQKNSRQMEMERAKNRQRKINAQGGREWDSEKVEEDIVDRKGRSSEFVRGGFGGVIRGRGGMSGNREGEEVFEDSGNTRGRGGFEIRGRGRGGRGGRGGKSGNSQTVPSSEDFPSLPPSTSSAKVEGTNKAPNVDQPAGAWADEMATPDEASEQKSWPVAG
ncbi:hypothetical protein HYFRA_00010047 [Hymenoscyphus fraxineus]|uniref:Uncharacterized protein n=1 Tax=Hymenoscyphus fraxineus TaxID=746836 RepID=A0A9N9PSN1_9HELO|nr:hypothetical protein HYFRA_00010047 [Hymenoscyphus fraxineus]